MELEEYFRSTKGLGVLSTADEKGKVDSAVYSKPKVVDDGRVAFIMSDRLSISNVRKNPYAAYLFKENGEGWKGVRLFLEYENETRETADVAAACRKEYPGPYCGENYLQGASLVTFRVVSVLPRVGDGRGYPVTPGRIRPFPADLRYIKQTGRKAPMGPQEAKR